MRQKTAKHAQFSQKAGIGINRRALDVNDKHTSTPEVIFLRRIPSPTSFQVPAHFFRAPSMLAITSHKNIKNSLLLFAVCELVSRDYDGHRGVATRHYVSLVDCANLWLVETYMKLGGESGLPMQIPQRILT